MKNPCQVITITTPDKFILKGLLFGNSKAKRCIICVHGLCSNAFAKHDLLAPLVNKDTSVMFFSNRGSGMINGSLKVDRRKPKGTKWGPMVGSAHEKFTDCVYDIQGVVDLAKQNGAKEIILAGHSTGCQKSVYYLSKTGKQKNIKGVILLAPLSDYAVGKAMFPKELLERVKKQAQKLVKTGKPHQLLVEEGWPWVQDAQRFLSLFSPDSEEEVFCYATENKKPKALQKIKIPVLALLGQDDPMKDRPAQQIADWLNQNIKAKNKQINIIPGADHGFDGKELEAQEIIREWLKVNYS